MPYNLVPHSHFPCLPRSIPYSSGQETRYATGYRTQCGAYAEIEERLGEALLTSRDQQVTECYVDQSRHCRCRYDAYLTVHSVTARPASSRGISAPFAQVPMQGCPCQHFAVVSKALELGGREGTVVFSTVAHRLMSVVLAGVGR